jgi:hypothetical protein
MARPFCTLHQKGNRKRVGTKMSDNENDGGDNSYEEKVL